MPFKLRSVLFVALIASAGCSPAPSPSDPPSGTGGSAAGGAGGNKPGSGGSPSASGGSTGGSPSTGGSSGTGGASGNGGTGGSSDTGGSSGAGGTGGSGTPDDGGATSDVTVIVDATTPPGDGGPINLDGPIPPYEGPPVGPEVKMDCPEDPTAGFTEYKDTFKVEHPYDLPTSARFSIEGGIYNFWVMQGDKKHNPTSTAKNPRTEARWSQNFRTGIRMFSADIYWDKSVSKGTIVMQVHTTTTGIGPVYMVANGNGVSPLDASKVPGGLYDRWINLKVEINSATTGSRYWVNNCLVTTKGSGVRGDGNNYFKLGVYHCDSGTCRAKAKNIKLYMK
jgi:hypothetical protein